MFKRVTTFLTVLFMGLVLTVRSPVKADTFSIPFSAIPDLLNAFYTVAAGGKIEFSALIGDITGIDDFLVNLHDYYNEHYTQPLLQSTQGLIDIGLSGLALEGIDSIDSVNNISIPITPQDIANFIGYDVNWANRYNDVDQIIINPDTNYSSYLNSINGNGFWFANFPVNTRTYNGVTASNLKASPSDISWFIPSNANSYFRDTKSDIYSVYNSNIFDLHIYGSNDSYVFNQTITVTNSSGMFNFIDNGPTFGTTACRGGIYINNDRFVVFDNTATSLSYYSSGTLSTVFNYITKYFRNVNIYVNDELWSYVGDIEYPGISLNDSTAVGNTGNITYGVYPLTSSGDIGLDLAKWGEYIFNKCISGTDALTMDTVIDDGWDLVNTDDGERAITEEDEEDVAKVIHGFVDTTATTPTPTPDIGDPPVLKIIPPILELPDEIWPDGGRDTTVLAQMVHATDVAIPNDIMTVIWSTIGLLVVGGLISILHK